MHYIFVLVNTKVEEGTELRETMWATFLTLVMLLSGARFLAKRGAIIVAFPGFSNVEDEACRFAKDEDVDEENDERRFWVDILNQTQFTVWLQEPLFPLSHSHTRSSSPLFF